MDKNDPLQPDQWPPEKDDRTEASGAGDINEDPPESGGKREAGDPGDSGDWIDLEEPDLPAASGPKIERTGTEAAPFSLEESSPGDSGEYVHSLDVCSNCGAPMRSGNMVCLRCGWNMRTNQLETVKTGVVEVDEDGKEPTEQEEPEEAVRKTPLSEPGRGGLKVPLIMAGVATALLLLGNLLNFGGLYPNDQPPEGVLGSSLAFFRALVTMVLGTCCGLLALSFLGWLLKARLGDLALAAARMLGIVGVMMIVDFIDLPSSNLWVLLESVIELGLKTFFFGALSAYFFRLNFRDAATLTLSFIMAAICMVAVTGLVRLVS